MLTLRPFWRYYGGKWRAAPRYPKPRYDTIVEPFAGAAGYSLRYPDRKVILVEKYAVIAEVWRYLIRVGANEILRIPEVEDIRDLPSWVPEGARLLIGFCMNSANASPRVSLSRGLQKLNAEHGCSYGWSKKHRENVARQVGSIRHWQILEGDYTAAPDVEATWFIDPPYQRAGIHYKHPSTAISFPALGQWCRRTCRGQVIVCEAEGADWLPFRPLPGGPVKSFGAAGKTQKSAEVIWTSCEHHTIAALQRPCIICGA